MSASTMARIEAGQAALDRPRPELSHPVLSQHPCCAALPTPAMGRRRFLQLAGGGLALGALLAQGASASEPCPDAGAYDAMVLSCIDPRFQEPVRQYLDGRGLTNKYSQMTIAGGAIAAVAPTFESWHAAVWANINASLKLHKFPRVIVMQHVCCGAAGLAYGHFTTDCDSKTGKSCQTSTRAEYRLHRAVARDFQEELHKRHPQLELEALLIDPSGETQDLLKAA